MTAYALFALAVWHAVDAVRSKAAAAAVNGAMWLVAAVTLQAALGILTLLNEVPIALALAHQAVAIAVLTLAVFQAERLAARPEPAQRNLALPAGHVRLN
jgi:cytochrome c oxidase assembly protein subunit 15